MANLEENLRRNAERLFSSSNALEQFITENEGHPDLSNKVLNVLLDHLNEIHDCYELNKGVDLLNVLVKKWRKDVDQLHSSALNIIERLKRFQRSSENRMQLRDRDESRREGSSHDGVDDITDEELDFLFSSAGLKTMKKNIRILPKFNRNTLELDHPIPDFRPTNKNLYVVDENGKRIGNRNEFDINGYMCDDLVVRNQMCFYCNHRNALEEPQNACSVADRNKPGCSSAYFNESIDNGGHQVNESPGQYENGTLEREQSLSEEINDDERMSFECDINGQRLQSVVDHNQPGCSSEYFSEPTDHNGHMANESFGNVSNISLENCENGINERRQSLANEINDELLMSFQRDINRQRLQAGERLSRLSRRSDNVVDVNDVEVFGWKSALTEKYPEEKFREGNVFKVPAPRNTKESSVVNLMDIFQRNTRVNTKLMLDPCCGRFLATEAKLRKIINASKSNRVMSMFEALSISTGDNTYRNLMADDESNNDDDNQEFMDITDDNMPPNNANDTFFGIETDHQSSAVLDFVQNVSPVAPRIIDAENVDGTENEFDESSEIFDQFMSEDDAVSSALPDWEEWVRTINEAHSKAESRQYFNMDERMEEILNSLDDEILFSSLVQNKPKECIPLEFLSCITMANKGDIIIKNDSTQELPNGDFVIKKVK